MSSRRKVLVLGSDNGSFMSVIRSLGRRGIDVDIGWCPPDAPAARSRYVRRSHRLPRPGGDDGWVEPFAELMAAERFDLVLPTNDPTLIPLQLAHARLEPHGRLYRLSDHAFAVTFDKIRTRELAEATGVPVAPGAVIAAPDEIDAALAGRPYPLVIKPQASFNVDDLERRNSVTRAYDAAAARAAIRERLPRGQVLIEENVGGPGWGVEILAADGEILLSQQHRRLHEPLHGGASSYRCTVPRDPRFLDAVRRLVRALDYTGVAMFEFKGDPTSGRWVLIEINGRFWGSLPLSLVAGIDFPYALFQLVVEGRTDVPDAYRTGVYARNLKRDLKWMWVNLRADRTDPVLATVPWPRVVSEVRNVVLGREHPDQFVADDPAPGLTELAEVARMGGVLMRHHLIERTLLARRRRQRARRAFLDAQTILFVCRGNICRSPFAAALARRALAGSVEVLSAATSGDCGRRSPHLARTAARDFGVDLDEHRSRLLTPDLAERAEAIFAFDHHNWSELRRRFPRSRDRVHLVGALGDGPLLIDDPIDADGDGFRHIYGLIADALGEAVRSHGENGGPPEPLTGPRSAPAPGGSAR